MTITFLIENNNLYLIYSPEGPFWLSWFSENIKAYNPDEILSIRKTFYFRKDDLLNFDDLANSNEDIQDRNYPELKFLFATLKNQYFCIRKEILDTKYDVLITSHAFIQKSVHARINKEVFPHISSLMRFFVTDNKISIFRKIDELCNEPIVIGGDMPNALPVEKFQTLVKNFPTLTELNHYANSRVTNVLQEYFSSMEDGESTLQKYFERKKNKLEKQGIHLKNSNITLPQSLFESEIQKLKGIEEVIREVLEDKQKTKPESYWQDTIVQILPFIFPKYVAVLSKVKINICELDGEQSRREIDFMLVNSDGYVDILEIKKSEKSYVLNGEYRNNYTPKKELIGSIMQVETYIYYLNSLTRTEEESLSKKFKDKLPDNLTIKIRNPKGIILLGRSDDFDDKKKHDFELIKRQYSNITDILTYDDLLSRIGNIVSSLEKRKNQSKTNDNPR